MAIDIEFEFYEATKNFNTCRTIASSAQPRHFIIQSGPKVGTQMHYKLNATLYTYFWPTLYYRNMSELGIDASSLHAEHMFKPIVILTVAYPGISFGEGEVQQIQLRTEDRENGDLGAVAP